MHFRVPDCDTSSPVIAIESQPNVLCKRSPDSKSRSEWPSQSQPNAAKYLPQSPRREEIRPKSFETPHTVENIYMWRVVAASITFENSTFGTFREDGFNPRRTYLKGQANPGQIVLKMESKNPPKKTRKSVSKSSPIQESLMPAVLKCPFAPLDKWPAEPPF
jgi:hypothetical protein